jgi:hypothetical protein
MELLEVHRSPVRLFLFGVAGLILMLAAFDIVWVHRVSTPPEQTNGVLSSTGYNQRRADYLWGIPMLLAGSALFGYSVVTLMRRDPVLVVRDDGIAFSVGRPGAGAVLVPWGAVRDVYSAADPDPDGGAPTDVVVFDLFSGDGLPDEPWDAQWDGTRLKVNATGWEQRPEDVVVHARVALEASRRALPPEGEGDG